MTSERQRKARWPGVALQDLVARWFRARVGLAQDIGVGRPLGPGEPDVAVSRPLPGPKVAAPLISPL